MVINEENFPLYELVLQSPDNEEGAALARKEFMAAQVGDADAVYEFVMDIQTVAVNIPGNPDLAKHLPGVTPEMVEKTLQSSRAVFEELAGNGHADSQVMVDCYNAEGIGLSAPKAGGSGASTAPGMQP